MDISLITITPITGADEERVAVRISDEANTILLDVDEIFGIAQWLAIHFELEAEDGEPEPEPQQAAFEEEEAPYEETIAAVLPRTRRTVSIEDLVTDGNTPGPLRVMKSPRPAV